MLQATYEDKIDEKKLARLPIINTEDPSKKFTEKEEKWLREMACYEFMNLEQPGLMHTFSYGSAGNSMKFTFFHGGKYRLPRFIARHIDSRSTPMWDWKPDGSGRLQKYRAGGKSRFQMREVFE